MVHKVVLGSRVFQDIEDIAERWDFTGDRPAGPEENAPTPQASGQAAGAMAPNEGIRRTSAHPKGGNWDCHQFRAHERRRLPGLPVRFGERVLAEARLVHHRRRLWPSGGAESRPPKHADSHWVIDELDLDKPSIPTPKGRLEPTSPRDSLVDEGDTSDDTHFSHLPSEVRQSIAANMPPKRRKQQSVVDTSNDYGGPLVQGDIGHFVDVGRWQEQGESMALDLAMAESLATRSPVGHNAGFCDFLVAMGDSSSGKSLESAVAGLSPEPRKQLDGDFHDAQGEGDLHPTIPVR